MKQLKLKSMQKSTFLQVRFIQYFLAIFICSLLGSVPKVLAYGGGFPPAPPFLPHVKLICVSETKIINLPFGLSRTITIPKCRVELVKDTNNDFKKRLDDFVNRVINGQN